MAGASQGRRHDAVPGQEALLRRVQVQQVQEKVDVGKQLGQHGADVQKVPPLRLPTQTGETMSIRHTVSMLTSALARSIIDVRI